MSDPVSGPAGTAFVFGRFRFLPGQRLLLDGDHPVKLGARSLSILLALLEQAGRVVSNRDLVSVVWPDTHVEEGNLRVHIAALRRALRDGAEGGDRFVVNVPGRGYSFVAPVRTVEAGGMVSPPPDPAAALLPSRPGVVLPVTLTRVIGRDSVVELLGETLSRHRIVTLIGPAGMGKTTVALAVARAMAGSFADAVTFVDFGAITLPALVPSTIAAALGLAVPSEMMMPAVTAFLADKSRLLVLDNCEHVIDAVADAAEAIFGSAPGVRVMATSREPLRVTGERIHRLAPLESPPVSAKLTAAEAMMYPSIQLFVERASATLDGFALTDADAPIAADICRRLDGIALAIELAARHLAIFGLRELLARLDDRFGLLTGGRRTALSRHQTLAAAVDWSFDLLSPEGQSLLPRLAVLCGDFTLDAAISLADRNDPLTVLPELVELVSKSMVVANVKARPAYRLLDTMRLYGLGKLRQQGDLPRLRRAHAEYFHHLFANAETDALTMSQADWNATYASQLDNARAALDWAASEDGDAALYITLTIRVVPLWIHLSLMGECGRRVDHALGLLSDTAPDAAPSRMQLLAARAWSLLYGADHAGEAGAMWEATLALAEQLNDADYRMRASLGLWIFRANRGDIRTARHVAQALMDLVAGTADPFSHILAERLMGTTLHYRGEQKTARQLLERMLVRYGEIGAGTRVAGIQVDPRATARYFLSRILWLQGFADQARAMTELNLEEGIPDGHALSVSNILGQGACVVALFTGDDVAARHYGDMLLEHENRHGLLLWREWAQALRGLLAIRAGDAAAGLDAMHAVLMAAGEAGLRPRYTPLWGEYAAALGQNGSVEQGLTVIGAVLARCEAREEWWYQPEAHRIRGELLSARGRDDAAESCFEQAMKLARRQDAPAWELRAADSLARLKLRQGRKAQARALLAPVLGGFREGLDTRDVRRARALIDGLSQEDAPTAPGRTASGSFRPPGLGRSGVPIVRAHVGDPRKVH